MLETVYVDDKLEMLVTDIPKCLYREVNITTVSPSSMSPYILKGTDRYNSRCIRTGESYCN